MTVAVTGRAASILGAPGESSQLYGTTIGGYVQGCSSHSDLGPGRNFPWDSRACHGDGEGQLRDHSARRRAWPPLPKMSSITRAAPATVSARS